jgi:2-polyprenyl-3-methyl-5-hydroxy-6-metoxy-1,4-benzoquinol methylase
MVTAIDNIRDYWQAGFVNRHYYVLDQDIKDPALSQRFDLITCISVLEHIPEHTLAVRNMIRLLNPGGYLVLTVPYSEDRYIPDVYQIPTSMGYGKGERYVTQVFSRRELGVWVQENQAQLLQEEFWRTYTGGITSCGKALRPAELSSKHEPHDLGCFVLQKGPLNSTRAAREDS